MSGVEEAAAFLKSYDGPPVSIMEVCGTHTAAIFHSGLRSLLPKGVRLISGPGCPVCVTAQGYVDKLLEYAMKPGHCVLSFGDMLRVPGTNGSLLGRRGDGAQFRMVYSPLNAVEIAQANPDTQFIVAAVGFETTAPAYALLLQELTARNIQNVKLLTALKAILPAMEFICATEAHVDAFLCPGHVSSVIGAGAYRKLCDTWHKPMCVAGFDGAHLLAALRELLTELGQHRAEVVNLYPEAVTEAGNRKALDILEQYFEPGEAVWRGIGSLPGSGLYLREEYARYDAGSRDLGDTAEIPAGCLCADVIRGRVDPDGCPNFGTACTPEEPLGACMVSEEGACAVWYKNMVVK